MSPDGHRASVERGLQRSFVALVTLFGVLWIGTLTATRELGTLTFLVAAGLNIVAWIGLGIRAWLVRLGQAEAWIATAMGALVLLVMPYEAVIVVPPGTRIQLAVIPAVLTAGFLPLRAAVVAILVVSGSYLATAIPAEGFESAGGLWPVLAAAVATAVMVPTMRSAADAADSAHDNLIQARMEDSLAAGRHAAHREFQRLLHDHISAALRVIAGGRLSADEVRQACREAITALTTEPALSVNGAEDLSNELRKLSSSTPLDLDLDEGIVVPAAVARATVRAASEALRNVDRHAQASLVVVTARRVPDGFAVTVRDNGIGRYVPDRPGSVGVRRSVVERMADVGGAATIEATPGEGTAVTLSWTQLSAPAEHPSRARVLGLVVGDVRRPLAAVTLPYLAGMGIIAGLNVGQAANTVALIAWYVVVCALTGVLLWRADRQLTLPGSAAWIGLILGMVWIGLLLMPSDGLANYASWPIGSVGPLLGILAAIRPPWDALLACVLEMALIFVAIGFGVLSAPTLPQLLPALFAPAFGTLVGVVLAATLMRFGRVVAGARGEQLALVSARAHRNGRIALHRERVAEIGRELVPFLNSVATGEIPCDDPAARSRAAQLDQLARDELHLPGVLDSPTRTLLASVRADGCVVSFHVDSDTVDVPRLAVPALRAALHDSPNEVTLSVFPQPEGLLVCLVAVPGAESRRERLVGALRHLSPDVDATEEATCVSVVA